MRSIAAAGLLAAMLLVGCATTPTARQAPIASIPAATVPQPPVRSVPEPSPATPLVATSPRARPSGAFAGLEGWAEDDHAAAFHAFAAGCRAARDPELAKTCRRALNLGELTEDQARRFLETNFRPEPVGDPGVLTAYFTPVYEARRVRESDFTAPVRPRPVDLPRQQPATPTATYASRESIDRRPAADALAWLRPEDLFFLQIQGSGVLRFPDGLARRAAFDGSNGALFVGIAAPMRRLGLLVDQDTSAERIRAWLAANRGSAADAVMRLNPRYVFFRLEPDDGVEPAGAAGVRLIPGRALAVDQSQHGMGEVLWVDATSPTLAGAFPAYRRLAMALDTGGAIKGQVRADLYLGRGPEAGLEAGRVRHVLHLYRLTPVSPPSS